MGSLCTLADLRKTGGTGGRSISDWSPGSVCLGFVLDVHLPPALLRDPRLVLPACLNW